MTDVERHTVGWGDRGTAQTLELMARLVNGRGGVSSPLVVQDARRLAASAGARDTWLQALQIRGWLARVWRFVDDPPDRELLRDPENMMQEYHQFGEITGDCDEAAVLGAALGKAIGCDAQFTVVAFQDPAGGGAAPFSHVFASLLTPEGKTLELDITKPAGPVPQVSRSLTFDV